MWRVPLYLRDTDLLLTPRWGDLFLPVQVLLFAAVCLVPLFLIVLLYRYELQLVSRWTAGGLLLLRLLVLAIVLSLVLLQPIVAQTSTEELPGRVLVAVDRSDSMGVTD